MTRPCDASFRIEIRRTGLSSYCLHSEQILPVEKAAAFSFFEDPRNLKEITPEWLNLRVLNAEMCGSVFEGAEFAYEIHWLGRKIPWRARIVNYNPPHEFTDIQEVGPYRHWEHRHLFSDTIDGTVMIDEVIYSVPFSWLGGLIHSAIIRKQLLGIFGYRAKRVNEWVLLKKERGPLFMNEIK